MNELVSPIVNRFVARIGTLPSIGRVMGFNPFARTDISTLLVSEVDGVPTLRAWWVQGPKMEAKWLTEMSPSTIVRAWTYEIHGVEGIAPAYEGDVREAGEELNTLRDNAAAVSDVLDADDMDLDGLAFKTWPCEWQDEPTHVAFGDAESLFPLAYAVITKKVLTMPART